MSFYLFISLLVPSFVRRRQSIHLFMALVLRSLLLVWSLESISAVINGTAGEVTLYFRDNFVMKSPLFTSF